MIKGKFISIEGIEGAGKSTALNFIKDFLQKANKEIVITREPGGTALAEILRELLLHSQLNEAMTKETELLLMFAGRAEHLHHVILPAIQAGKWVISDRFIDASYAYQGGGRAIAISYIKQLDDWIVAENRPDLTLLLDLSPEVGFKRALQRGLGKDRIEEEKIDFFTRVRDAYLARASQDPTRIKVIDASASLEEVKIAIEKELKDFLRVN